MCPGADRGQQVLTTADAALADAELGAGAGAVEGDADEDGVLAPDAGVPVVDPEPEPEELGPVAELGPVEELGPVAAEPPGADADAGAMAGRAGDGVDGAGRGGGAVDGARQAVREEAAGAVLGAQHRDADDLPPRSCRQLACLTTALHVARLSSAGTLTMCMQQSELS